METVSIGILEASAIIKNEISGVVQTMRADIKDFAERSEESFKALGQAAGVITGALTAVAGGIVALGARGSDVADIRGEFDGLTSSVGLSADALSSRLVQATDGIITKFDLMQTANKAMSSGLRISVDDFGLLGESARVLADRIGGDTKSVFDSLTTAMTYGRTRALRPYGIDVVELDEKVREAGSGLSQYQRLQVTQKAILEQLGRVTKESGDIQLDFNDKIARARATFQNFTDDVAVAIGNSPVLATVMDTIGNAIERAFGGDQSERVNTINRYVSQFAIYAVDAASVVLEFGRAGVNAFYGVRAGVFALLEGLFNTEVKLREVQIATLEYANSIPGLRGNFDGMLQSARESQVVADAIRVSFQQTKEGALDSAQSINSGFDSVQATIARMRGEMVTASNATIDTTRTSRALKQAAEEHAEAEKARAEALKRSAEETAKFNAALSQMGLVTEAQVNAKLVEFNSVLERATREGVSYDAAILAVGKSLQELAMKAAQSGIHVAALDGALALFNETIQGTIDAGFERELELTTAQLIEMQGGLSDIDFEAIQARISADQLSASYRAFGLKTPQELQKVAAESKRHYEVLAASGTATADQLKKAYQQMVDDQKMTTGQLPGFWQTVVVPGINSALTNLQTAVSGTFAQMAMGAKSFGDGFTDIWNSIKATAINIFNDIAEAFINGAIKRMLNAMAGSNNSFASGFGRMMGGGQGGGGGVNWGGIAGMGGGSTTTAAMGWGGAASNSGVAAAGMGLSTGTGAGTSGAAASTGISSAVIGTAVAAAGTAVAGVGLGMLGKKLFGGAGLAAGGFGAASGAATGAAIGSVVPGLGTAAGAIIGGVAGGLSGYFGLSKKEKQGRAAVSEIEANLASTLTAEQQLEAGGEAWKMTVIAVRDAFLATGRSSEEANAAVEALWKSSSQGAGAVERAVAPIQAAFDEIAAKQAEAAAAVEEGATESTASVEDATQASMDMAKALEEGVETGTKLHVVADSVEDMEKQLTNAADAADRLREILSRMPEPKTTVGSGNSYGSGVSPSSYVTPSSSAASSQKFAVYIDGKQVTDAVVRNIGSRSAYYTGGGNR